MLENHHFRVGMPSFETDSNICTKGAIPILSLFAIQN